MALLVAVLVALVAPGLVAELIAVTTGLKPLDAGARLITWTKSVAADAEPVARVVNRSVASCPATVTVADAGSTALTKARPAPRVIV